MALGPGSKLGVYEVTAKIGAGGMGEVYRAHDTTLDRDVAIKVLPDAFATDPERLARFEREAKVLASLNHPNIAAIYGLEKSDDTRALILELVEGPTLQDRIAKGPIPLDEALPIARQIAEALEAAHEQGIIHRDLKPANVKVKDDGMVKVLDFGLAKALAPDRSDTEAANAPTATAAGTRDGVILGTAAYMSPEQARGKPLDKRTDIWAFGCVVFEMLTAVRAFGGDNATDVLANVLVAEPRLDELPAATPTMIRALLGRCLDRDRWQRLRDIGEARVVLDQCVAGPGRSVHAPPGAERSTSRSLRSTVPLVAVSLLVGLGVSLLFRGAPVAPRQATRLTLTLPTQQQFVGPGQSPLALSPDGRLIVYAARDAEETSLYFRSLDGFDARKVPGTTGGHSPFFSADGEWFGFQQGREVKKMRVSGGLPVTMFETGLLLGAVWTTDDTIVFSDSRSAGLWRVPANGGDREELSAPGTMNDGHRFPYVLPDGSGILFNIDAFDADNEPRLGFLPAGESEWRILQTAASRYGGLKYVPPGYLVYGQAGQVLAMPFDVASGQVTGTAVPLVEGVARNPASDMHYFAVADNGTLAYIPGAVSESRLVWVEEDGSLTEIGRGPGVITAPQLSPDATRIATITRTLGELDVWTFDVERGVGVVLTTDEQSAAINPTYDVVPVWSPDGETVTIALDGNLHTLSASGDGDTELLLDRPRRQWALDWSRDGEIMLFGESHPDTQEDVWMFSPVSGETEPLVAGVASEGSARLSSSGAWVAYVSDETGSQEVYVQSVQTPGRRVRVSSAGGIRPVWSADDTKLFYRSASGLVTAELLLGPTPTAAEETVVISGAAAPLWFSVAPDGQRILTVAAAADSAISEIHIVLNWFEDLQARVPTGR